MNEIYVITYLRGIMPIDLYAVVDKDRAKQLLEEKFTTIQNNCEEYGHSIIDLRKYDNHWIFTIDEKCQNVYCGLFLKTIKVKE